MNAFKWATTAAAAGALALVASADTETPWFNVNFDADTTWASGQTAMTVAGVNGASGGTFDKATGVEDESSQLIDYQSESAKEAYELTAADGQVLELNTQGSELTFSPAIPNPANNGDLTVIEADVFFIASESAPSGIADDETVQVALYLKAEDGETPVFQALTRENGNNVWVDLNYDLTGEDVASGIWRKIQISVDKVSETATYSIGLKGGEVTEVGTMSLANQDNPMISEVAFKGTGLVDNFVGKALSSDAIELTYAAAVNGASEGFINEVATTEETVQFEIFPASDAEGAAALSKIVTYAYNASGNVVAKTYTVTFVGSDIVLTDENDDAETFTGAANSSLFLDVDVSSFVAGYSEAPADPIVAIEVWYGEEETPSEFPTQEEFATAMATAFADSATASAGIDSTDGGFKVSFSAPYAGTYQLVSATTVDAATFTPVENAEVTVEANAAVTLTDDDTTASAKFYKIKLVDPSASN